MLFLAVTLGFFVENQREHLVEHKREKQYIRSMISDLQTDTSKLGQIDKNHAKTKRHLDSLLIHFGESITGHFSPAFYNNLSALFGFTNFLYTNRTIDQLKNSGSMRLIRKQAASDSIMDYDSQVRDFLIQQQDLLLLFEATCDELNHLYNFRLLNNELKKNTMKQLAANKSLDLLLTHDKQKTEGFYNMLNLYAGTLEGKRQQAVALKEKANQLIGFLKKQYHLK